MNIEAPYSETADLVLGDMTIGGTVNKDAYVNAAGDEIDSRLGYVYSLPLPDTLPDHAVKLLRKINNFIASGRLIMALAVGGEDSSLHAYGLSLVQEAHNDLALILNGSLPLDTAVKNSASDANKGPTVANQDIFSPITAFEDEFFEDNVFVPRTSTSPATWRPGPYEDRDF